MGNGTCSGRKGDIDRLTKLTDFEWWSEAMLQTQDEIDKWENDDRVVTLVHTNEEALNISAEYAIRQCTDKGLHLCQWNARNADRAVYAKCNAVSSVRLTVDPHTTGRDR